MTTIKDVAKLADTSISTVSRVLNDKSVKDETRKKILESIERLDYKVNKQAQGLRTNESMMVGVVISSLTHSYWMKIVKNIQKHLHKYDYNLLLVDTEGDIAKEKKRLKFLLDKNVDGIIIAPISSEFIHIKEIGQEVPLVLLDNLLDDFQEDAVINDDINNVYSAVEILIKNGHREIGVICDNSCYTGQERLKGYQRAFEDYRLQINKDFIKCAKYSVENGYSLTKELMEMSPRLTAIIPTNYDFTKGSIIALNELHIAIPQDLSFIGYDFEDLNYLFAPPLSTLKGAFNEIGKEAADLIYKKMKGFKNSDVIEIKRIKGTIISEKSVQTIDL